MVGVALASGWFYGLTAGPMEWGDLVLRLRVGRENVSGGRAAGECVLFVANLFVGTVKVDLVVGTKLNSSPVSDLPCAVDLKFPVALKALAFVLGLFLVTKRVMLLGGSFGGVR